MRKSKAKLEEKVLAGVDESTMKSANDGTESDATNTESSDDDGEEDVLHVNALQPASDNDDATDSSDEEVRRDMQLSESELLTQDLRNTIGNVPVRWYDDFDHVGYDSTGQKIAKSAPTNKSEIDEFLAKMEDPDYW
jgi:ribosome biogenesis protein ERB1